LLDRVVTDDALDVLAADGLVLTGADPRVGLRAEPARLRVSEQLREAAALQQLGEQRPQRGREGAEVHAARGGAGAPAGAAAEKAAEDVLQPAAAAPTGRTAAEKAAEQVVQPTATLAATTGALGQAAEEIVESAHGRCSFGRGDPSSHKRSTGECDGRDGRQLHRERCPEPASVPRDVQALRRREG